MVVVTLFNELVYVFSVDKMFQRQNISSMKRLKAIGLYLVLLRISVSILAMKMMAKATAILVPMAIPCV